MGEVGSVPDLPSYLHAHGLKCHFGGNRERQPIVHECQCAYFLQSQFFLCFLSYPARCHQITAGSALPGTGFSGGETAAAFPALQTSSHRVQKPGPAWLWLFPSTKSRLLTALQQLFIYSRVCLSKDLISGGKIPSVCETSTN